MSLTKTNDSFISVAPGTKKKIIWFSGILTVLLFIALSAADKPLRTGVAENGIVSFELAGNLTQAQAVLNSWNEKAKIYAAFSLGIDFLFLFAYSFFLAFSILKIVEIFSSGANKNIFVRTGVFLAGLMFIAALFDAAENVCLINLLFGSLNEILPTLAFYFASLKFFIVALGILYIIISLIFLLFNKKRRA